MCQYKRNFLSISQLCDLFAVCGSNYLNSYIDFANNFSKTNKHMICLQKKVFFSNYQILVIDLKFRIIFCYRFKMKMKYSDSEVKTIETKKIKYGNIFLLKFAK